MASWRIDFKLNNNTPKTFSEEPNSINKNRPGFKPESIEEAFMVINMLFDLVINMKNKNTRVVRSYLARSGGKKITYTNYE